MVAAFVARAMAARGIHYGWLMAGLVFLVSTLVLAGVSPALADAPPTPPARNFDAKLPRPFGMSLRGALESRSAYGGTAPVRVREQLVDVRITVDADASWAAAHPGA